MVLDQLRHHATYDEVLRVEPARENLVHQRAERARQQIVARLKELAQLRSSAALEALKHGDRKEALRLYDEAFQTGYAAPAAAEGRLKLYQDQSNRCKFLVEEAKVLLERANREDERRRAVDLLATATAVPLPGDHYYDRALQMLKDLGHPK